MATELEGKPLKFTALFDSKDAETQMSAFLKKIQDINTKGVSNNANKAVHKASGQYRTILDDVTQSFGDFVKSNDRFYTSIAKSEMGLQKVRNEQNILNSELRKGLVTEDDYVNKSAELTKIRERLSQQLKDNKAQLQQYNSVANAKPKFSKEDTLNELANAHGNNTNPAPSLSSVDALAKVTQDSLNKLNSELSELDNKLKQGSISSEKYAESTGEINKKIKEVILNQEHFNKNSQKPVISTDELGRQKTILEAVSEEYRELLEDATGAFGMMTPQAQRLNNNLTSLRQESDNLKAAQKELQSAYKAGDITQRQYLDGSRNLAVQQNEVSNRISRTRKELNDLNAADRRAIGSIAEKTARLTQLQNSYNQLSQAQRNNINVGGRIRKEYQELTREVAKLNKELSGVKAQGIGGALNTIRGIAGAAGIAFGAQQLISFGKELFDIAKQAEGIELRFAKIGDTAGLDKLRAATRNTVSDLELMKLAVNADNFRIPMDVLVKGLEFATRRASETGQSVDYLVNSFVTGLGRKSKLILDNLGISANELNEEIQKTGDFATGVGNIIDREMRKSGESVDTLSEKTNRLSTVWQNFKKDLSANFSKIFNRGAPGAGEIETLTQTYKKLFDEIKTGSEKARTSFVSDQQSRLDAVNKQLSGLNLQSKEFEKIYQRERKAGRGQSPQRMLDDMRKPLVEQQQALQASLSYAKGITAEMAIQERQSKNIFSQSELEEKLSDAQNLYKNAIGDKARQDAKKEVDKWQKLLDGVSMKSLSSASKKGEAEAKKLAKEIAKDNEDRTKLLDQWAKTDAAYLNKQLSRDQQEIQSVKDKYRDIREAIEKHNKETKGDEIGLTGFDKSVDTAISAVKVRQANDRKLKQYQEDYQNYLEYEHLKRTQSTTTANEVLGKYQDVVSKMQIEYAAMTAKSSIGMISPTDELYRNQLGEALKDELKRRSKQRNDDYIEAIQLAETIGEAELKIRKKYTDAYAQLGKNASEEQKDNLKRSYLEDLENLIENTPKFKKAIENIDRSSEAMLANAYRRGKDVMLSLVEGLESASVDQKAELKKIFSNFFDKGAANAEMSNWDALSDASNGFQQLVAASLELSMNTSDTLQSLTAMLSVSSSISRTLGNLFDNDGLKNISSKIGFFAPLLGVGSAISGYFDRRREENNQKVQAQIEKNNERQLKSTEAVTKMLEAQLTLINEIYGDKRLQEYSKNLVEIATNYRNINNQIKGLYKMTGDAFTDSILERLNRGESAKDIENSFTKFSNEWYKARDITWDKNLSKRDKFEGLSSDIKDARQEIIRLEAEAALTGDAKTISLIEQLKTQVNLYESTLNKLREENTGNAFTSILSDVRSLFLNSGEDAADAWSKGFDKIMENYMMQKFSRDWLEEKLQVFYEDFDKMSQSGGEISDKERDELKKRWDDIQKEGQERVNKLKETLKLEGSEASENSKGSLSKEIQNITENTANRLEAEFGGLRLAQLELLSTTKSNHGDYLSIANQKLTALNAIQANTYRTASNTNELSAIRVAIVELNNKVTNNNMFKRGAGL